MTEESIYRHITKMLREQDEDVEIEDVEVEEEGPIEDVGDVIPVEDAEAALVDLGVALGLDVSVGEEGEEEVEFEDEEVEDVELEEVYEVSDVMLRRELKKMRRIREGDDAVDASPASGGLGGDVVGDVILDVDEEDLINALADELGSSDVPAPTVEARRRRARARRSTPRKTRKVNENRTNRVLNSKLVKYRSAVGTLKNQLTEMNLFNAKLLYANKLMQNRNLSSKQQRAVVEALDAARTLREAKLLYKSLTTSLKKKGTLSEGRMRRVLGSSSRPTRRGGSTDNGVGVDRWAILAGINKD